MRSRGSEAAARRRNLSPQRVLWAIAFTLVASAIVPAAGSTDRKTSSASASRFLAQQEPPLTQYRAYRRMHAHSERFNQEAWLEAWTEFDEQGFRYEIVSEKGSDYVRNKVLKAVLRREQELISEGHAERATLSPENYVFSDGTGPSDGLRYVLLRPKRKDVLLVDGRMVLSQDATDLLRVEGRLAKNPSFWTSLVNVIRHYAKLDGIRVPVSTESIAKVKFAGTSRMEVTYEYETINGRPVSLTARVSQASTIGR